MDRGSCRMPRLVGMILLVILIIVFMLKITMPETSEAEDATHATVSYVRRIPINYRHDNSVMSIAESKVSTSSCVEPVSTVSVVSQKEPESSSTVTSYHTITDTNVTLTDQELHDLAAVVYLECGSCSYECQLAVVSTIINRVVVDHLDLMSMIHDADQYSPAPRISYTTPSESCIQAVQDVIENGTTLPRYVKYFRAYYYHSWGDQQPYMNIDGVYFSYSAAQREKLGD